MKMHKWSKLEFFLSAVKYFIDVPNQMWYYHLFFIWNILISKTRFTHIKSFTFHSTKGLPSFTSMKSSFAIVVKTPSRLEQNRNIIYYSFGTSSLNPSDLIITMWKRYSQIKNIYQSICQIISLEYHRDNNAQYRRIIWCFKEYSPKRLQTLGNAILMK